VDRLILDHSNKLSDCLGSSPTSPSPIYIMKSSQGERERR
jgi:hypothetical protein